VSQDYFFFQIFRRLRQSVTRASNHPQSKLERMYWKKADTSINQHGGWPLKQARL
jgi:hypothetical protein